MDIAGTLAARRAVRRRGALQALGLGVTALAAGSVATEAKGKKGRKQKVKNRCPGQVASCETAFASFCSKPGTQEECLATARECCASFGTCDAGSAMACFVSRFFTE